MIVHSNAFVFSTCFPEMVFRHGYMFIVFPELFITYPLHQITAAPCAATTNVIRFKGCYNINKVFSLFSPLG